VADVSARIGVSQHSLYKWIKVFSAPAARRQAQMSQTEELGRLDDLSRAMTLEKDALGMELVRELLPQRVRSVSRRQGQPAGRTSGAGDGGASGSVDPVEGF